MADGTDTELLFVAISDYRRPLEEVDALREAHWRWLEERYAEGRILVSGRQRPPLGGVIVARGADLAALEAMLADDPFAQHGIARYRVTGFAPAPAPLRSPEAQRFLHRTRPRGPGRIGRSAR